MKKNKKDLDQWINTCVKVLMHGGEMFYEGTLLEEQKNGILLKSSKKRIYVPYESILSMEGDLS
jgi:hypothetical protein